jgi:protein gp37
MAEGTAIEWADDSWNPIRARNIATGVVGHYCVKVSPGCKRCYAERLQIWPIGSGIRYAAQDRHLVEIFLDEKVLEQPTSRRSPRDIFPCSMTDLFLDQHPDDWLAKIFDVMYRTKQHRYLVLTKRAERMRDFIVGSHGAGNNAFAFGNVWFGISAENQEEWDDRAPFIDDMTRLGFNTWASFEPLLGEVNCRLWRVQWAVIGGESGPGARAARVEHIRRLLRHLEYLKIRPFVKQMGSYVVDRNDAGFDGCVPGSWPLRADGCDPDVTHDIHGYIENYQGADCRIRLVDRKGGDMAEWPEDLRVRMEPA